MPWNGKRRKPHKPLEVTRCCCGECSGACPDPPGKHLARCEPCHYGERHPRSTLDEALGWYCSAAGHHENKCSTVAEHRAKVAAVHGSIITMMKTLDHAVDVATSRKWGQMTFEEL